MRYPQLDMEGLTAVVALAETGDVVNASMLLNIGTSAMLKRLSKAEGVLQAKLFRRTEKGIIPTAEGRVYVQEASRAIEHAVLAENKVVAARKLRERKLRVGYSTYLPSRLLVLLARMKREGVPGMTVEQKSGLTHEIEAAVADSLLHVGIGFYPVTHPHLSVRILTEDPLVVCMPIGHPLASRATIRPEDLEGQPVISIARYALPALHEELSEFHRGFGVELNVIADAYAPFEALCLVEQRIGLCFLSRSAASTDRRIVAKPLASRILTRKCGVFFHEDNAIPVVQKSVSLMVQKLKHAHL